MNTLKLATAAALALACGNVGEPAAPSGGVVRGVIHYTGAKDGPLQVAVFPSFPPRGAPIASQRIEAPTWPQEYEIRGVPPGRYFVLAVVDSDPNDGGNYHPTVDPGGAFGRYEAPTSLDVGAAQGADGVEIELVDPSPDSPWASRRYR